MIAAIEVAGLTKEFRPRLRDEGVRAIDEVSVSLEAGRVHGLLGRNGAGKTTLMKLITGQIFATAGQIRVFGENPVENPAVLARTCFIQESQVYPDFLTARQLFALAARLYPHWDEGYAGSVTGQFAVPLDRRLKKLSRGQLSAVGIVVGLAARAELTFFDEPYLGLDAVARTAFFDLLLADLAENPRTVVLSTHHIDEAADLLERLVVLDAGRVVLDEEAETLRSRAYEVSGLARAVREFTSGKALGNLQTLGQLATASVLSGLTDADRARAAELGLDLSPVSLQTLFVHLLQDAATGRPSATAPAMPASLGGAGS